MTKHGRFRGWHRHSKCGQNVVGSWKQSREKHWTDGSFVLNVFSQAIMPKPEGAHNLSHVVAVLLRCEFFVWNESIYCSLSVLPRTFCSRLL